MKRVIMMVMVAILGIGITHADMSEGLFCLVRKDTVVISLKQTPGYYKCKDTISSLESLIIDTAKDLVKIQKYINRGSDLSYRKTIKVQKQTLFTTLMASKNTIALNMATFETNLLKKSIKYFILRVTPYKITLQKSLVKLRAYTGDTSPAIASYTQLLTAQITTIESFSTVTTTSQLSDLLAKYVYLKKKIGGKSD